MIYDNLDNLETYFHSGEPLYEAVCFARDQAAELPDGDHGLPCGNMLARVMTYKTEPAEQRLFENHRKFIDVQVMLQGSERHDVVTARELIPDGDFNIGKDIGRFKASGLFATIHLEPGWFAVYFPQDTHRPNCCIGEPVPVRKVCMKIPVSG